VVFTVLYAPFASIDESSDAFTYVYPNESIDVRIETDLEDEASEL
jgi:hypothetical protein